MSSENEDPVESTSATVCAICEMALADEDKRLICPSEACGKLTCLSCIQRMIDVMFGQPAFNYPFKCGACTVPLDQSFFLEFSIERGLYEKYLACLFPLFWSKDCLEENEVLAQCKNFSSTSSSIYSVYSIGPFCPYFEIHITDACPLQFFTCQHPSCGKKSCLICLHAIDNDDEIDSKHRTYCHELRANKQMIEKAIESGCQQHCPYCQLTGIKDDGCTHIVCQRCEQPWCYLCGLKEHECVVGENVEPSLSAHNEDWQSNKNRCPMYLYNIHELDVQWPERDCDCLEHFHRHRTLSQLFDVLQIIGEERFGRVNQYFGLIDASGYAIDQIKDYQNRTLINYPSTTNE